MVPNQHFHHGKWSAQNCDQLSLGHCTTSQYPAVTPNLLAGSNVNRLADTVHVFCRFYEPFLFWLASARHIVTPALWSADPAIVLGAASLA